MAERCHHQVESLVGGGSSLGRDRGGFAQHEDHVQVERDLWVMLHAARGPAIEEHG
jgi:hypothetical protein